MKRTFLKTRFFHNIKRMYMFMVITGITQYSIFIWDSLSNPVIQRAFPRIVLIGYQTIVFILSLFRNVISKSNQINSLKNAQSVFFRGSTVRHTISRISEFGRVTVTIIIIVRPGYFLDNSIGIEPPDTVRSTDDFTSGVTYILMKIFTSENFIYGIFFLV